MPDAVELKPPSMAINHDTLLAQRLALYRSTEGLADDLGVSVACHPGCTPLNVVNPGTLLPDGAELGVGEAPHYRIRRDRLCEPLHIRNSSAAQGAPGERARIRLEYQKPRTPHV
jgi:hypothetical protein